MRKYRRKRFLGGLIFLAVLAGAAAIVMLLWNALIPQIIGWSAIGYWQAAGLIILCKLLFGGLGRPHRHGHMDAHNKFRHYYKETEGMSRRDRHEYIRRRMAGFADDCCGNPHGEKRGEDYNPQTE